MAVKMQFRMNRTCLIHLYFYVDGLIRGTKYAIKRIFISVNEEEINIIFCLF